MPSYSGVWTLTAQYQAIGGQNWPMAPGAPTSVSATAGDTEATVTFVAPTFVGIPPPITGYLATSTPGGFTVTGASSPLTVSGLSNGTAYTIAVQATNAVGYGPAGTSGSVSPAAPPRVVVHAGANNVIQYFVLATSGDAIDFGDLPGSWFWSGGASNSTRGLFAGGSIGGTGINDIAYVTIASTGNSTDFGDLVIPRNYNAGLANNTRAVFGGGSNDEGVSFSSSMDYVTIASTGNATNFGNLTRGGRRWAALASPTRGILAGGYSGSADNTIEYITIASTGNATDFGDLIDGSTSNNFMTGCSSSTRGLMTGSAGPNIIQYITIASTGNSIDFGDLTLVTTNLGAASSKTKGTFFGGTSGSPDYVTINVISYVTIDTTGNATDFGDLLATSGGTNAAVGFCADNGGVS